MSSIPFTIYDRETGEIKRRGRCPDHLLGKQVHAGESILPGQALCDIQHFVRMDVATGKKEVCMHPPEEVARRAPEGWQLPIADDQAALAAKGINPALAGRLAQRRRDRVLPSN